VQIQLSFAHFFGGGKKKPIFLYEKIEPRKTLIVITSFFNSTDFVVFFNAKNWEIIGIFLLVQIQLSLFNFLGKQNSQKKFI
jgi:hypothetical protein